MINNSQSSNENAKPKPHSWRPWGDHPIIIGIIVLTAIGSLVIGIAALVITIISTNFNRLEKTADGPASQNSVNLQNFPTPCQQADQKWGFCNREDGKIKVNAIYDQVKPFTEEGLALVMIRNTTFPYARTGFIDKNGNVVIPLTNSIYDSFSEGLARFKLYNHWGFIDTTGKRVIPDMYDDATSFHNGKAKVRFGKRITYIRKNGEEDWLDHTISDLEEDFSFK